MSIKSRGLVFVTFFVNCVVVGLLIAGLVTDHWIEADVKSHKTKNATGTINFGLFSGRKDLNYGIGTRLTSIDVLATLRSEPNFMSYWLWLGTFVGTGLGLLASTIGGIASILKSSSSQKKHGTMVLLFFSNGASALSQVLAVICWLGEFYAYLKENVLAAEDLSKSLHTINLADLGHSFYFILAGVLFVIINLLILIVVFAMEKRERRFVRRPEPVEEKSAGAIMLY